MDVFVRNFEHIFVQKFDITHKHFPDDWTKRSTFIASNFFQERYFQKRIKLEKYYVESEKLINSFEMIKVTRLFIDQLEYLFTNLLKTFWHYYYRK